MPRHPRHFATSPRRTHPRLRAIAGIVAALAMLALASHARAEIDPSSPSPQVDDRAAAGASPSYTLADATLFASLGLGVLHHVDHVLRDNHSGFPFRRDVTPFTPSLLVYPVLLTPYFLDSGPLTNLLASGTVYLGVQAAHLFAEPPHDQHDPWVDGSNRLGVRSPALGRTAQGVSLALSGALLANITANVIDGVRYGFTWKRVRDASPGRAAVAPYATSSGGGLVLTLSFD